MPTSYEVPQWLNPQCVMVYVMFYLTDSQAREDEIRGRDFE
jgi:hypothetical protein